MASLLERNLLVGCHLYEPFAGGSAVSLGLLANGFITSATWVERDPIIYAFWKMVKDNPEALIARMIEGKISLLAWKRMLPLRDIKRPTKANLYDLGYAGTAFFNRTCFSGIVVVARLAASLKQRRHIKSIAASTKGSWRLRSETAHP